MGVSLCKHRNANRGSLEELGVSDDYQWDGLQEDRIDAYLDAKAKLEEQLEEKQGVDALGSNWVQSLPEEAQEMLKMLLVRRAIGLVHVLKPIEENRKGMRWLHSQGAISPVHWSSYQRAEEESAAELQTLSQESQFLSPGSPANVLIRTAVQLYNTHGLSWPQGGKDEFEIHPEAREIATLQLQIPLERESGESLGLSLQQEPPKESRVPGQESRLVVQNVLPDGFVHKFNESQNDASRQINVGDRIIAVVDCSVPEQDRKPVGGDADAMFQIITKDQNAVTQLVFIVARPLGPPLRFKAGQRVKAHYGDKGWQNGTVVKVWEQHPNGARSPYVIRLDEGQIVMAPRDSDDCVAKLGDEGPTDSSSKKSHVDGWAKGMFKSKSGKDEEDEKEDDANPHPEAKELTAMRLQFLLKREPGERLGLALNHEPPLEVRQPGMQSCLVITNVVPGGYVEKFNQEQQDLAQRLHPGDRIVAIMNAGAPEEERKPVGGDSKAMLEVITQDQNASTPLVFFVIRALGPPLRYKPGQRVKCQLGDAGWQVGTIVKCWEQGKPYVVRLESNQMVFAPRDSDECIMKADPRFNVGDDVMANHDGSYKQGKIAEVGGEKGAYEIKLDDQEETVCAPADANQFLRPLARFKVGDEVRANVASEFVIGTIEAVYHPMWVYSIRVEEKGLVYAPEDTDAFVAAA